MHFHFDITVNDVFLEYIICKIVAEDEIELKRSMLKITSRGIRGFLGGKSVICQDVPS